MVRSYSEILAIRALYGDDSSNELPVDSTTIVERVFGFLLVCSPWTSQ